MADNGVDVRIVAVQQNEMCYTNLVYYPLSPPEAIPLSSFVDDWFTNGVMAKIYAVTSTQIRFLTVQFTLRGTPNAGMTQTVSVDHTGDIAGDVMPVYNTLTLRKNPDNDAITPVGQEPFKPGRISFSGVPEALQNNGVLNPAYQTAIDNLCIGLQFAGGLFSPACGLVMDREVSNPLGFARVPVQSVYFQRFGTQLTRKR